MKNVTWRTKWNKDEKLQILGDHIAENFQNETNLSQFTFFFEPSAVRSSEDSLIVTFFFVFSFLSKKISRLFSKNKE